MKNPKLLIVNALENKFDSVHKKYLSPNFNVSFLGLNKIPMDEARKILIENASLADIVLSSWCDGVVTTLSNIEKKFKLICFMRSYEILTDYYIKQIYWKNVDGLIFVANHAHEVANQRLGHLISEIPQTTIYNSVQLSQYPFRNNRNGKKIGCVAYLNHKKGIGLLLQCFSAAIKLDPSFEIHIAGKFTEYRYSIYYRHLIHEMGIANKVFFHGWIENMQAFYNSIDYIISTSPWEGCPNNIIEAMSCGVSPLIHNWPGAKSLFPQEFVFTDLDDFKRILAAPRGNDIKLRNWVAKYFNTETQMEKLNQFISGIFAAAEKICANDK